MRHEEYIEQYLPTKRQRLAINVGAHHGRWCETLSPLFDEVLAIEANPGAADKIRGLTLDNVKVLDGAGWIVSGQRMDFNVRGGDAMGSALACRDIMRDSGVEQVIQVPTVAIDDIPKTHCDLIICDVEGAEVQVLMGATRTIEAHRPQLIIECHEIEHREWIETWLTRAGYNVAIVHKPTIEQSDSRWDRNAFVIGCHWRYRGTW